MRRTKIICTLGPSTENEKTITKLIKAGAEVIRLNMSHQSHEEHLKRINLVKKVRESLKKPVALLLDTKGPEIRIGLFEKEKITLKKNQLFRLYTKKVLGDETGVSISFESLPQEVNVGQKILIDDGLIELEVKKCESDFVECVVLNSGVISSQKGVNVPGVHLSLPFIAPKDKKDIAFAAKHDFDFIAASFTRSARDVILVKKELQSLGASDIKIIAKIENSDGIKNIDEILGVSDGIMVARGDLGVEIPLEDIPIIQKKLIEKANKEGKHVIIATQMLESMMKNPRPTRAEITDVANAIYDSASAIMLSGETANGKYPVEAVKTMSTIAQKAEEDINYQSRFNKLEGINRIDITTAISHSTCSAAQDLEAAAIVTVTKCGRTAEKIAKYRPSCKIIGGTTEEKVLRQLNLCWGTTPILMEEKANTDDLINHVVARVHGEGLLKNGDLMVITSGVPLGVSGATNLIKVQLVGQILASGYGLGKSLSVSAKLCICKDIKKFEKDFKPGTIVVVKETTDEMLPLIEQSVGIIAEMPGMNSHAARLAEKLKIPVFVGVKNATTTLKNNQKVSMDTKKGIIYKDLEKSTK